MELTEKGFRKSRRRVDKAQQPELSEGGGGGGNVVWWLISQSWCEQLSVGASKKKIPFTVENGGCLWSTP